MKDHPSEGAGPHGKDRPTALHPADRIAPDADNWSQLCQWHYELGVIEGYAQGRADADAELVGALAEALGGPSETDYRLAVQAHHRMCDQRARRQAFDRDAGIPRRGDYPGRAA